MGIKIKQEIVRAITAVTIWASLAAGNFLFQSFTRSPDWLTAFDRSWWQGLALIIYATLVGRENGQL